MTVIDPADAVTAASMPESAQDIVFEISMASARAIFSTIQDPLHVDVTGTYLLDRRSVHCFCTILVLLVVEMQQCEGGQSENDARVGDQQTYARKAR